MRFILLFSIIIGFETFLYGGEQTSDINEALHLSMEKNIPILIDFMTDW